MNPEDKLRSIEKKELVKRIWKIIIKYLIREPIFEDMTKPFLAKIFGMLRISPKILGLLVSVLNYFRYYAYIA